MVENLAKVACARHEEHDPDRAQPSGGRHKEGMKMRPIKEFNDCIANDVVAAFFAAAREVGNKFGLKLGLWGRPSVSNCELIFRLCATVPGVARKNYLLVAGRAGLPKDGLGRTFRCGHHTYTITGLHPGKPFDVETTREDGADYRFRASDVRRYLKLRKKAAK